MLAAQDGQIKGLVYNSFYAEYSGPINGLGPYAGLFARILNALTSRGDLQNLTMLPWDGIIPAQSEGFLSRCPRWCPFCYGDQLRKDRERHTPLLWSLAPYKRCVVHGSRAPRPQLTAQQRREFSAAIEKRFANCPAPPPLREVGHPYGLGRSALRYWFPDLCKRICEQRIKGRRINAEIAASGRAKIVADTVNALVKSGQQPARRKVDVEIRKHGLALARPEVFQEYSRAIRGGTE